MLSEIMKLTRQFENEVWLYLGDELDKSRREFWDKKIAELPELQKLLNESKQLQNIYNSEILNDIEDHAFDRIVAKAARPNLFTKMFAWVNGLFQSDNEQGISAPKMALATTLAIAAIIMLLVTDKPNQVKTISNELLDWNAGSITQQMNDIETGISLVDQDNYKRYMILKFSKEGWNKNVYSITKDLEKMKQELEEISM